MQVAGRGTRAQMNRTQLSRYILAKRKDEAIVNAGTTAMKTPGAKLLVLSGSRGVDRK